MLDCLPAACTPHTCTLHIELLSCDAGALLGASSNSRRKREHEGIQQGIISLALRQPEALWQGFLAACLVLWSSSVLGQAADASFSPFSWLRLYAGSSDAPVYE